MGRYVSHGEWSGGNVAKARQYWAARLPLACLECGEPVLPTQRWVVAHRIPRWKAPELALMPSNQTVSHRPCSDKTSNAEQQAARAAREAAMPDWQKRARATRKAAKTGATSRVFRGATPPEPPFPSEVFSLIDPSLVPDDTKWPDVIDGTPWLAEFREIPEDAVAPRFMTAPHPLAVGSYGDAFLEWADEQPGLHPKRTTGMRFFQRLLAMRLLEHDVEGRLLWRNVLITLSRQCGKSWFLRALIAWRIQQRSLFGDEEQTVIHVAHKLIAAQEVWRPAKFWGQAQGWDVRTANGEQALESPDGGRWLVRAASDGVGVGFALSMLVGDEAWRLNRDVIESADAALTEAESPQLVLVSTAGDSASDLFGSYRADALDELETPNNTLIVEWSAPRDLPVEDPATWRLASPHWSERRERAVADAFKKLERGEWVQNYLNHWRPTVRKNVDPTRPAFTEEQLDAVNGTAPVSRDVAAVEDWFGKGFAVAFADRSPQGQARVTVQLVDTNEQAAALVAVHAATVRAVVVGKTLLTDPAFEHKFAMTGVMMNTRNTVVELRRLLKDDAFRHDGSEAFVEQALAVRVVEGVNGPSVRSEEQMGAIKVAVYAAKAARTLPAVPQIY